MSRTLIVTNDFPPSQGGIETFARHIAGLCLAATLHRLTSAT
ncbi:hypothetical protein [Rhodococcus sp. NPDC076796]